ncbi:hypothetical protein [Paenibacillus ginsengarvi]|uniref:Uncharacterized protein n=1 Tax=Paenibacillus ginsengarvi TaxID=400777 RepID=A0A3B0BXE1_9BACL|nr:hypothetical protein [Paenibacillus ginsengarvi]RKN77078.1 hypothetical protein D7M11_23935 [Paenibacillus ginsengarvi]
MKFLNNLLGGLIGSILGGILSVYGTLWVLEVDFTVDNEAAVVELVSAESTIKKMLQEEPFQPNYKLLNLDVNWKKVVLNFKNEQLMEVVIDLKRLDELRNIILQTQSTEEKQILINKYKNEVEILRNGGFLQRRIEEMKEVISKADLKTGFFKSPGFSEKENNVDKYSLGVLGHK